MLGKRVSTESQYSDLFFAGLMVGGKTIFPREISSDRSPMAWGGVGQDFGLSAKLLVHAFTEHAASALAANTIWGSIVGALIPLAGLPMYDALGFGWGHSLLGFISATLVPIPIILLVKSGERIRKCARHQVG